jgi:hypothetical protein
MRVPGRVQLKGSQTPDIAPPVVGAVVDLLHDRGEVELVLEGGFVQRSPTEWRESFSDNFPMARRAW